MPVTRNLAILLPFGQVSAYGFLLIVVLSFVACCLLASAAEPGAAVRRRVRDPFRQRRSHGAGFAARFVKGVMPRVMPATCSRSLSLPFEPLSARAWFPVVALLLLVIPRPTVAAVSATPRNVLILESLAIHNINSPGYLNPRFLESELRARVPWPVNFYVEYLQSRRFDDKDFEKAVVETLKHTYRGQKLDLVMPEAYPALQFALRHRDVLFPGVPIVFFNVDTSRLAGREMGPGVTGVTETWSLATIDLALHLHPDCDTVAIITENSAFERYWLAMVHGELLRYQNKLKEIDLVALPTSQLLDRVATLSPQTVILFQQLPEDSTQPAMGIYDILAWAEQHRPTYSIFPEICLNHGCIGGAEADQSEDVSLAAQLATRVLSGERPENIPVACTTRQKITVDWRELQRWHIPESALPAGTVIEYKPPSPWQQYKWEILATLVFVLLLLALIADLLTNLIRRRKAEVSLKKLAGELLHVQDEERRRMARDLHDGTAQDLTAISLFLGEALEDSASGPNGSRRLLEEAHALSRKALQEVRSVSYALRPPILDTMGLVPALKWYFDGLKKRSSLRILLEAPPEIEPNAEIDGTLFRIVQEGMSNILRHSGADTAVVRLERDSHSVRMSVEDNGHGMGVKTLSGVGNDVSLGVGVAGMRERVRQLGGEFEIRSGSGGTTVLVSLPIG